jgi:hypothetical protein
VRLCLSRAVPENDKVRVLEADIGNRNSHFVQSYVWRIRQ